MRNKKFVVMFVLIVEIVCSTLTFTSPKSYAAELTPTADQYMEVKLLSTEIVPGAGTQAILELWAYNLNFKGFDVRFSYDDTKLSPSNITTNVATTGEDYFEFENGFGGFMEKVPYQEPESNVLRCILALNPILDGEGNPTYESTNSYLLRNTPNGDYIDSTGGVLMGKFSFLLNEGAQIDDTTFALVSSETNSPLTGVKIAYNSTDYYSDPSTFRFTMITTGTVSGSITTSSTQGTHIANIKAYPAGTIDWVNMTNHTDLDQITPAGTIVTNNDGTYSLELTQGSYDILIDKAGYLDHIYTNVTVIKNSDVPLEAKTLIPGDTNKDGFIELEDMVTFSRGYDISIGNENYNVGLDYNEDGIIELEDMVIFYHYYDNQRQIINKE